MRGFALLLVAGATRDATAAPDTVCAETVARAVQHRYESVKDLDARFEQTSQVASLGAAAGRAPVRSRGRVVFAKPGLMRWAYEEPEPSLVVSDGHVVWIFDPAAREAQRFPTGAGFLSSVAVQFLVGEGDLLRDFRVKASGCDEPMVTLELVPKQDATYEKLVLVVERKSGEVSETRVHDLVGNVTQVVFQQMRLNQSPPPSTFVFEPPVGVKVVELKEPGPR